MEWVISAVVTLIPPSSNSFDPVSSRTSTPVNIPSPSMPAGRAQPAVDQVVPEKSMRKPWSSPAPGWPYQVKALAALTPPGRHQVEVVVHVVLVEVREKDGGDIPGR